MKTKFLQTLGDWKALQTQKLSCFCYNLREYSKRKALLQKAMWIWKHTKKCQQIMEMGMGSDNSAVLSHDLT